MNFLSANDIRKKWIDFFKKKDHLFVPPANLIPKDDPSLLWINSGVATLKDYFTGVKNPPHNRLVNSQISIRTNDIYNVGVTARHHTIFEMLGNFSIGDYFKIEAINFGYEFLTKELGIPVDKLYITVYKEDLITLAEWKKMGIIPEHIVLTDRDRNFWDVGQGPCGPCTEIFYDRGPKYDPENVGEKLFFEDLENDRYVEIWNIVFSEFNNDGNNNYTPLTRKNIDTGAGLERIASIFQNAPTNYDTDLFMPCILKLQELSTFKYLPEAYFDGSAQQKEINRAYRIIVDHLKANIFAIADGAIPGNKERGAILRRLIRRAMVYAQKLNLSSSFIEITCNELINIMKDFYPKLVENKKKIIEVLGSEQKLFDATIEKGLELFNQILNTEKTFSAENTFNLVSTYGFPLEVIKEKAEEHHVTIDIEGYEKMFANHQNLSRANLVNKGMSQQASGLIDFKDKSTFLYSLPKTNGKVIGMFDEKFNSISNSKSKCWIIFDKTVLYATSGGQIHDNGTITFGKNQFPIIDIIKGPNGQHVHCIDLNGFNVKIDDQAILEIDRVFRRNVSRNHTVEHILEMILNKNIDASIKQEGAFKTDKYFTFDFKYNKKLDDKQLKVIEDKVNEVILANHDLTTKKYSYDDALQLGVVGHFTEVYKKIKGKLRVVSIGDINKEICGGTHVKNTKQIQNFMIIAYEHKSADMWRIRGITSNKTINVYLADQIEALQAKIISINNKYVSYKLHSKEYEMLYSQLDYSCTSEKYIILKNNYDKLVELTNSLFKDAEKNSNNQVQAEIINQEKFINTQGSISYCVVNNVDTKLLMSLVAQLSNEDKQHLHFIINMLSDKIQFFASADKALNYHCGDLIKRISGFVNGNGGGKDTYAQGGTTDINKLNDAIDFLKNYKF